MTPQDTTDARVAELGRASRRAAALSVLGFLVVVASFGYAVIQLRNLERDREALQRDVSRLRDSVRVLRDQTDKLAKTQASVLDFLGGVTSGERIRLIDRSVDWEKTKQYVMSLESGPRKTAILNAILLAWKELPFSLTNKGLAQGLDSPHFIQIVLARAGVSVRQTPGERLSDAMMREFQKVDTPLPGDLIFYRGNVGNFVVMYIAPGASGGNGVAVGTLQTGEELQVLDTNNVNTPVYPFIGFFRVPYPE